jgi:hypothetical protein
MLELLKDPPPPPDDAVRCIAVGRLPLLDICQHQHHAISTRRARDGEREKELSGKWSERTASEEKEIAEILKGGREKQMRKKRKNRDRKRETREGGERE